MMETPPMKKLIFLAISAFSLAVATQASEPADAAVIAISTDEIRADPAVLEGQSVVSSGQPDAEILSLAKDAGYTTIIDLRTEGEDRGLDEVAAVEALGMSYISLPVAGAGGISFENATALDALLSEIDGPVLLHCGSGNRVGALVALSASMAGQSDEDALAAGKQAGLTRLEPVVIERLNED